MNFKTLALSSVLALTSVFGSVSGAEARPSQCWFFEGSSASPEYCNVTRRTNVDGTFWTIHYKGINMEVVLYGSGTAEVWMDGDNNNGRNWYTWEYDSEGDIALFGNNGKSLFTFRK